VNPQNAQCSNKGTILVNSLDDLKQTTVTSKYTHIFDSDSPKQRDHVHQKLQSLTQ